MIPPLNHSEALHFLNDEFLGFVLTENLIEPDPDRNVFHQIPTMAFRENCAVNNIEFNVYVSSDEFCTLVLLDPSEGNMTLMILFGAEQVTRERMKFDNVVSNVQRPVVDNTQSSCI